MELRLDQVTKRYDAGAGAAIAVDRIDLTFPSGKTTALLGPSGCGKSTVLRLLIGLTTPDAGEIVVDGRPLPSYADRASAPAHRLRDPGRRPVPPPHRRGERDADGPPPAAGTPPASPAAWTSSGP